MHRKNSDPILDKLNSLLHSINSYHASGMKIYLEAINKLQKTATILLGPLTSLWRIKRELESLIQKQNFPSEAARASGTKIIFDNKAYTEPELISFIQDAICEADEKLTNFETKIKGSSRLANHSSESGTESAPQSSEDSDDAAESESHSRPKPF